MHSAPRSLSRTSTLAACRLASLALMTFASGPALAVDGDIVESQTEFILPAAPVGGQVGGAIALIEDLGGPGLDALAIGSPLVNTPGGFEQGLLNLLFLDASGNITSTREISDTVSGDPNNVFSFGNASRFGSSIASLGDFDNDGNPEIAVGVPGLRSGSTQLVGGLWIIDLTPSTGIPLAAQRIGDNEGGFPSGILGQGDQFGAAIASLGDWDGDGIGDLAVGAPFDDDAGLNDPGAIYILYMNANGTVREHEKISASVGGFSPAPVSRGRFGSGVAAVGDQNADGRPDLAVGAAAAFQGGSVWILNMAPGCFATTPNCSVESETEITTGTPGFDGDLNSDSKFGDALTFMPAASSADTDRLLVGAQGFGTGGFDDGTMWILDLEEGAINASRRIGNQEGWPVDLSSIDQFGAMLAPLGDLDSNGINDFAVGAWGNSSTEANVWQVLVTQCPSLILRPVVYHNAEDEAQDPCSPVVLPDTPTVTLNLYIESGGVASPLTACDETVGGGTEMCAWDVRLELDPAYSLISFLPDQPGTEVSNLIDMPNELRLNWVGPAAPQNGAVRLGTLQVTNDGTGGAIRVAQGSAAVGASLQLQTIGLREIAVPEPSVPLALWSGLAALVALTHARRRSQLRGAAKQSARPPLAHRFSAAALIIAAFLVHQLAIPNTAVAIDSIKSQVRISEGESFFSAGSPATTDLGSSLAAPGDIDLDGTIDLVFGCCWTVGFNPDFRLFTVFLGDNGAPVIAPGRIPGEGFDLFARSITAIPDRDGDGRMDLLVGTRATGNGAPNQVSMIFLKEDGTRKPTRIQFGEGLGGFAGPIDEVGDRFGDSVAWLGDVNGDPLTQEFAVGAPGDDGGIANEGAIWILSLDATNTVTSEQKIRQVDLGLPPGTSFGEAVGALGDLDGNGTTDLMISAFGCQASTDGCLHTVLLEPNGAGGVQPVLVSTIAEGIGGLPTPLGSTINATDIAWMGDVPEGEGGIVAVGTDISDDAVFLMHLLPDGTVRDHYRIFEGAGVGEDLDVAISNAGFGSAVLAPGDLDGDGVHDLVVGARSAQRASGGPGSSGAVFIFQMIDSDSDFLDDNLDNCPGGPLIDPVLSFNPLQEDSDGDGVGDLCDVCPEVADPLQLDADGDGEGDACEPVVFTLQPTGSPAAPAWDLLLECGAFAVTEVNIAVVPPEGGASPALALTCPVAPPGGQCATFDGGLSSVVGTGLGAPAGVRSDSFYVQAIGNGLGGQLCDPLDPPSKLGELTTLPISGTNIAAAALGEEGVDTPGFGRPLATTGAGDVPLTEIELVTGDPIPQVTIRLGPAVFDAGVTRWDILLTNPSDRFHRVSFGLVAPFGTGTSDMRFVGCEGATAEPGAVRTCAAGLGLGPTINAGNSWTLGPAAAAQMPVGLREHTLYAVLEGGIPFAGGPPYMNIAGQPITLGTVELSGTPDLEPALILEGVDLIDNRLGTGPITPYVRSILGVITDLDEVQLVGQFNPAEDEDGDGIQDLADNCPFSQNVDQADNGGFLSFEPDARGDKCQCGDGSRNGIVDPVPLADPQEDLLEIRKFLLGDVMTPAAQADIQARCSVAGSPECDIRDLVLLEKALATGTPSAPRCDAALSPIPGS
ncbi:MAG: thrombospondin type 3 repeat-containing protein [Myxococcota bacterium]